MSNQLLERRHIVMCGLYKPTKLVVYPSSYSSPNSVTNPTNAYGPSTSTTYATATSNVIFYFDTSSLPSGIRITSVGLSAKVSSAGSGRHITVRSGTTNIIDQTITTGIVIKNFNLSSWTLSQLSSVNFRLTNSTNAQIRVYGATLTINFEYLEE